MPTTPTPVAGYKPPQWAQKSLAASSPPLTIIAPTRDTASSTTTSNVPLDFLVTPESTAAAAQGAAQFGITTFSVTGTLTMYVFDNASSAVHEQDLAITENPVQTQASLSDHSYLIPARLSVQLLMSDAMQSYVIGQFSGTQSRSVSAYQVLLQLQKAQVPLQVSTRLRQYTNMLIASIRADEDSSTRYGGKFHVSFKEVLLASAEVTHSTIGSTSEYSADPQTTNTTILGQSQTAPVPDAMVGNNSVANLVATSSVSSAGTAAINGTSGVLPQEASDIITNAGGISSNINQLPAAITLVAKSSQLYYVAGATESIASLPATITSLARYVGAKVPPTTFTQVANLASVGATVEGSGSWSSNSVLATNAVLSGVNRF